MQAELPSCVAQTVSCRTYPKAEASDFNVFDVTPGKYRWTVYSHSDGFDTRAMERLNSAQMDLIEAY